MKLIEKNPLPAVCVECIKKQNETGEFDDCYNCDFALERWTIVKDKTAERPVNPLSLTGPLKALHTKPNCFI